MERILLGYDASAGAESALEWVADRALRRDTRVEVVIVTNPLLQDRPVAEEQLDRAEQRLHTHVPSLPVETARIDGRMPAALTDAAADADILAIGVDSSRPIRESLHGWMSLRISAKSNVPTCIVPAGWSGTGGPVTLGLATDASSEGALTFAAAEAVAARENLRIVHAWASAMTADGGASTVPRRRARTQHHELLSAAAGRIRQSHPDLTIEPVLLEDNAVSALTIAAADSSLLVLGTHRRGLLAGGLYGSVGQDIVGHVSAPVVVVPPGR